MTMNYITIKGYVKNGKLEIEMPENVADGEARVEVPVMAGEQDIVHEDTPLSPEEIKEYLNFKGLTLGEIETGGWAGRGITDSVQFVEELRRRAWRKSELE
jgi:hypothetical protein